MIQQGTIVVDVGGEYIPETLRFDHHQRSFTDTFSPKHSTRLSSAGLVYKHFGRQVIAQILKLEESHQNVELLYWKIYEEFVEAVKSFYYPVAFNGILLTIKNDCKYSLMVLTTVFLSTHKI